MVIEVEVSESEKLTYVKVKGLTMEIGGLNGAGDNGVG